MCVCVTMILAGFYDGQLCQEAFLGLWLVVRAPRGSSRSSGPAEGRGSSAQLIKRLYRDRRPSQSARTGEVAGAPEGCNRRFSFAIRAKRRKTERRRMDRRRKRMRRKQKTTRRRRRRRRKRKEEEEVGERTKALKRRRRRRTSARERPRKATMVRRATKRRPKSPLRSRLVLWLAGWLVG